MKHSVDFIKVDGCDVSTSSFSPGRQRRKKQVPEQVHVKSVHHDPGNHQRLVHVEYKISMCRYGKSNHHLNELPDGDAELDGPEKTPDSRSTRT